MAANKGAKSRTEPAAVRSHSADALRGFLEQSRVVMDWHRERGQNFESKAGIILGFSGVILALATQVARPIGEVRGGWQIVLTILMATSTAAFVGSAVYAVRTLRAREYRYSSTAQLKREWIEYRDSASREETQIIGMFADSLICGGDDRSPIESLVDDADKRGKDYRWSLRLLFIGLLFQAAVAAILSIEVIRRDNTETSRVDSHQVVRCESQGQPKDSDG